MNINGVYNVLGAQSNHLVKIELCYRLSMKNSKFCLLVQKAEIHRDGVRLLLHLFNTSSHACKKVPFSHCYMSNICI